MAIITADDVRIGNDGQRVAIELPIDGRARRLYMAPKDAVILGNSLGNEGVDMLADGEGVPRVTGLQINPVQPGTTLLRIQLGEDGAVIVALDPAQVLAISKLAEGALEHGAPAGRA